MSKRKCVKKIKNRKKFVLSGSEIQDLTREVKKVILTIVVFNAIIYLRREKDEMNTIKFDNKNVKMVAHRGLSGLEKENTNAAFVAAGNRNYFGIETDIHRTLDGDFIVFHDDFTGRVCIDNMEVEKTTTACLRSLQLTDIDGVKGRTDLVMPTLTEYIRICKKYEKVAVLELKNVFKREDVFKICEIIEAEGYLDKVVFISFKLENLIYLRLKYPNQAAQYLVSTYDEGLKELLVSEKLDLDIKHTALTKEIIDDLHASGIIVNCWTVDDPERAAELVEMGVDMITSNILQGVN